MIKNSQKSKTEGELPQLDKGCPLKIKEKTMANILLNIERLEQRQMCTLIMSIP